MVLAGWCQLHTSKAYNSDEGWGITTHGDLFRDQSRYL
jgi:hypothetical protein